MNGKFVYSLNMIVEKFTPQMFSNSVCSNQVFFFSITVFIESLLFSSLTDLVLAHRPRRMIANQIVPCESHPAASPFPITVEAQAMLVGGVRLS